MRLTYTIALVIQVALCASSAALPVTKDTKGMIENTASHEIGDSMYSDGGRNLRRVDKQNVDDDEIEEERTFDLKKVASKLNPVTAAKKVVHSAHVRKSANEEAKREQWLAYLRSTVGKD
ncbi:Avirulence protein [Phytophthora megakarya]|uniref:RxLR effector protein n=1 Tax=Phytophthora megakarya TaxID=4795 RepID=A0A225WJ12_9STRA|nr:Avirulence protein [Phytophthora megakarya]